MRNLIRTQADEIERMLNWVSDQDREWWPFLFLRPVPEAPMSSLRVALFSALYGIFFGMLANVFVASTSREFVQLNVLTLPACTSAAFFVVYRLTFARCWNRRARRLSQEQALRTFD